MSSSTSRRGFFRDSLDEIFAAVDERSGRPSFKLSALPNLSDEDMGALKPALADTSSVHLDGDRYVCTWPDGSTDPIFSVGSKGEDVCSRMDGTTTLYAIAEALARNWNEPVPVAFATARCVFLDLVRRRICQPSNPLV